MSDALASETGRCGPTLSILCEMSDILLGEKHNALVEMLLHRLEDVKNPDCTAPRIVVLRGASGVGKTRVIQEFYERLRLGRGDAYWPPLVPMTPNVSVKRSDPLVSRKLVAPPIDEFVWPAGALPTFGWWGLNCERMATGSVLDVASLSSQMSRVHLPPLLLARKRVESPAQKSQRTMHELLEVVREASVNGSADVLEEALQQAGVSMPLFGVLMGIGVASIRASWRLARELRQLHSAVTSGAEAYRDRMALGTQVAEAWTSAAHADVPVVVAVEDLHFMGADVGALLEAVASQWTAPTLVVGTLWPEGQTRPVYREWIERVTERGLVEIVDVPALVEDDLARIVRHYAPNTAIKDAVEIAKLLPNPLYVRQWLAQDGTVEHIARHDGAVVLRDEGSGWLPEGNREVVRRRWNELDDIVRQVLTYAAAVEPVQDVVCRFSPTVVAQVIVSDHSNLPKGAVMEGMWRAYEQLFWCRYEGLTECFVESSLAGYVREEAGNRFGEARRAELRTLARDAAREWLTSAVEGIELPDGLEASLISRWYLGLEDVGVGRDDGVTVWAKAIALWRTAQEAAMASDLHRACELGESANALLELTDVPVEREAVLGVRSQIASWKLQIGATDEALDAYRCLVLELRADLGSDNPMTLAARSGLLDAMVCSGKAHQAIELYENLLSEQKRVLGPFSADVCGTQRALAKALSAVGRSSDAMAVLDELERRMAAAGDALIEESLALGVTRSGVLLDGGQNEEAIVKCEELVTRLARRYGAGHELVLLARGNLAAALRTGYCFGRAVEEYVDLVEDLIRVFGNRHLETLAARKNLASTVREAGDPVRAAEMLEALLDDQLRVLGPDHPHTLASRNDLALSVREAGDPVRAAKMFEELVIDTERVLGSDHIDALAARGNLASTIGRMRGPVREMEMLAELVPVMERALDSGHPHVLTARNDLALAVRRTGDPVRAENMLEKLASDVEHALGPNHPHALSVRGSLASTVREAGDPVRAAEMLEALLDDQLRVLGPDHPHTLASRNDLALSVREAGDPVRAAEMLEALLDDQLRVLGPDHPHTLASRNDLALSVREAGDPVRAAEMLEALLDDQLRVLGPDHPHTLITRSNLTGALWQTGNRIRVVEMLRDLIPTMERVFGPEHPHTLKTRNDLNAALRKGTLRRARKRRRG
ncbi:MAG: tetratricopeptide repeat protein [Actinomyces ruminicola]|nr:tetratricopeptide repeat protein [Actinomyces ruminicola]